jgi:hypothetical protein
MQEHHDVGQGGSVAVIGPAHGGSQIVAQHRLQEAPRRDVLLDVIADTSQCRGRDTGDVFSHRCHDPVP